MLYLLCTLQLGCIIYVPEQSGNRSAMGKTKIYVQFFGDTPLRFPEGFPH